MRISLIVAASENNVIGRDNSIPWHLPDDLKFFREKTKGHPVISGRKNFQSIVDVLGGPLPGRRNIIVTRNRDFQAPGCETASSLKEAISIAKEGNPEEIFIIGGGEIYLQSMDVCDTIYLTRVHAQIQGDVFFPEIDPASWKEVERKDHPADERHPYAFTFLTYQKNG